MLLDLIITIHNQSTRNKVQNKNKKIYKNTTF